MSRLTAKILTLSIMLVVSSFLIAADPTPVKVSNSNLLNEDDILAEYDGGKITRADVLNKISKLPPQHQGRYSTIDGQMQILDILCTEAVFYEKAKQLGIDKSPEVTERLEDLTRRFYLQEYYKRHVTSQVEITEEDKEQYYQENLQLFYLNPNITIEYIQTSTEQDALDAMQELADGASFAEVSDKYNQNTYARGLKGVIKNIRLNGNIPGVGNDYELEEYIRNSEVDQNHVYGPYHTELGWHIFRTVSWVPGRQREYQEVLPEIEQRIRPVMERRILEDIRSTLKDKYEVVIHEDIAAQIDLQAKKNNEDILFNVVVYSPHDELIYTIQDVLNAFDKLSPQEQIFYIKGEGAKGLIEQILIQDLFYIEAKALGYEQYFADTEDYKTLNRNIILRRAYEILVLDEIQVTNEEIAERYERDKENYAQPAQRTIQVLFFDNEKDAKKAWRKFRAAHRKNDEDKMTQIVKKYSTRPDKDIYPNQYDNGIVTGLVQDAEFSRLIWDNPVGYLSPVFTTANGDIVFFRTIDETPKSYRPQVEIEPRIIGAIKQEKEKAKLDQIKEELFVELNMVKYPERIRLTLSAEELFQYADTATRNRNYQDAIVFYDQIVKNYANGVDDYKAYFMKAFLVAEEMKDKELALELFHNFLEIYPEGDLHESARFMIDSLQGNTVDFENFEEVED